jgi:hypothetical protein
MTLHTGIEQVTFLTCQKLFTAEVAEHAETYSFLICVLSALSGEKLSQWMPQGRENVLT